MSLYLAKRVIKPLERFRKGENVGIVFGVARLEPRFNSASAHVKPGGIEAPATIPTSLGKEGEL